MSTEKELQQDFDSQEISGWKLVGPMALLAVLYVGYHWNDLDWQKQAPRLLFLVLGAIGIDATVHATFTSPFEINSYWFYKLVAGTFAATWMLQRELTLPVIAIASLIFAGFISIYYRSLELLTGFPIGEHVPAWKWGNTFIPFEKDPLLSTLLWAITHTAAWAVPSLVLRTF